MAGFVVADLRTLESAMEYGLGLKAGRVFEDLWGLRESCARRHMKRAARLRQMNLRQVVLAASCVRQRCGGATLKREVDLVIVGAGFGGSLMAMIAHRLGLSVVLLEQGRHPRVVIGESTTPLSNLLLERLSAAYDLPRVAPLAKWGSWQRAYPQVACGLKRGFSFFHKSGQLLVAASPHDDIADTHWYRADVDHFLVMEAARIGVEYRDRVRIESLNVSEEWGGACWVGRGGSVPSAG